MIITLGDNYDKYHSLWGDTITIEHEGEKYIGIVQADHPDFDKSLVDGGHYYGKVNYYLDVIKKLEYMKSKDLIGKKLNVMERSKVYTAIDTERTYQDSIWNCETSNSCGDHSPEEWFMYIEDYVNEAKHLLSRKNNQNSYPIAMDIMRKVASMAVCAMEQHGVRSRDIADVKIKTYE